jgi:hypothetical protein
LYEEESGTTQDDTDLTDAIDQWQKFMDDYEAIQSDKNTQKEAHESVKKALTAHKDDILLTKPGSKKRQYINLADDDNDSTTSASRSTPRSRSITHIFKDDSELKKADWIDIIKSGNNDDEAKARLNALEQKMDTIDQKLDQSTLETKQLLLQLLQRVEVNK